MIHIANKCDHVDINQLAHLLCDLDKIHHEVAPDRFPLYSLDQRKEYLQTIFDRGCIFYAEQNSQMIGFASVLKKGDALIIEHLFVKPEFRLNHIGKELVESIFSKFPTIEIFASVYAFNYGAIHFYEKFFNLSSLIFRRTGEG